MSTADRQTTAHNPAPEPTPAEHVLNDLVEEYEADRPRREAEAEILWPHRKENR